MVWRTLYLSAKDCSGYQQESEQAPACKGKKDSGQEPSFHGLGTHGHQDQHDWNRDAAQ